MFATRLNGRLDFFSLCLILKVKDKINKLVKLPILTVFNPDSIIQEIATRQLSSGRLQNW